jgi:hypothetical protein
VLVASLGSHSFLKASLPYLRIAVTTSVLWTSHRTETEGSTRASSSMPTMAEVKFMPAPPYSSGISKAIRPCSNICSTTAGSIFSFSSISRTLGATSSLAHLATDSASMRSVSEKWVIGVGVSEAVSISSGMYGSAYRRLELVVNVRWGKMHLRGIDRAVGATGARRVLALARGRNPLDNEVMVAL